jgi:hypothetical protein
MKNIKLDFLHSELNRTTEWVKFSDRKIGFVLVYYSIIVGHLISNKEYIVTYIKPLQGLIFWSYGLLLLFTLVSLFVGIFSLFKSIFPRLKNITTDNSIFYFGHISNSKFADYLKELKSISENDMKEQVAEQIHINSVIANQKMQNIQRSIRFLFLSSVLYMVLILL